MSRLNRRQTIVAASLLLVAALGLFWVGSFREARNVKAARDRLSQVLGPASPEFADPSLRQQPQTLPPDSSYTNPPGGFGPGNLLDAPFANIPSSGVDVQESDNAYTIHVPLADPQDASSVALDVMPNRIQISGQTGMRHNDATITSSFMQSFTTSSPVDPDHVTRNVERKDDGQTELVITIPKREPGASRQANRNNDRLESPDSTGNSAKPPTDDSNGYNQDAPFGPLDNTESHRVF